MDDTVNYIRRSGSSNLRGAFEILIKLVAHTPALIDLYVYKGLQHTVAPSGGYRQKVYRKMRTVAYSPCTPRGAALSSAVVTVKCCQRSQTSCVI